MNGSDRGYDGKPRLDAYFWDTPRLEIDLTKRVALSIYCARPPTRAVIEGSTVCMINAAYH
jgi:hypothetical protein